MSGEPTDSSDRSQVFPEGFPVGKSVGVTSDPLAEAVFWSRAETAGPWHLRHGHQDYWAWKVWVRQSDHPDAQRIWAGFKVRGPLGESLHQVPERLEFAAVLSVHLASAPIVARASELRGHLQALQFKPIDVVSSRNVKLLESHGVVHGGRVEEVLHPAHLTLLASLTSQDAYLVTDQQKVIDVAAHAWPIDVEKVPDFRSRILAPVRYGDHLGVVASCQGDFVIVKTSTRVVVPIQDLDPVMVEKSYRQLIGGM